MNLEIPHSYILASPVASPRDPGVVAGAVETSVGVVAGVWLVALSVSSRNVDMALKVLTFRLQLRGLAVPEKGSQTPVVALTNLKNMVR